MPEEWLTTQEAAELSGYHPEHLRRLLKARTIKGQKFGPVWQINRDSFVAYLEAATESKDKRRGPKD